MELGGMICPTAVQSRSSQLSVRSRQVSLHLSVLSVWAAFGSVRCVEVLVRRCVQQLVGSALKRLTLPTVDDNYPTAAEG
eukprot:15457930-Alexandrium_andersonii.AAC.1